MVSIIKRTRKLNTLLFIKNGPGAAVLPAEVTRIHMDFAVRSADGHMGPRKFWRHCLPRLKYHNPAVPMTVNRTNDNAGPALMTIHMNSPEVAARTRPVTSSTTQAYSSTAVVATSTSIAPTERTETINMKHRNESEILAQILAITKARQIMPTEEEADQIRALEEQKRRSDRDSEQMAIVNAARKHAAAELAAARGDPDAMEA